MTFFKKILTRFSIAMLFLIGFGALTAQGSSSEMSTEQIESLKETKSEKKYQKVKKTKKAKKITEGCVILPFDPKTKKPSDSLLSRHLRGGAICHFWIHKNLPIYKFHLVMGVDEIYELNVFERIKISKGNKKTISQTLEIGAIDASAKSEEFFVVEDLNFDGYKDIRLMFDRGVSGNEVYMYWLFHPSKNRFIENKDLDELVSPVFDLKTKTILTYYHLSSREYVNGTYKFAKNGKLIKIHEERQELIDKNNTSTLYKTVSRLKNGKWVSRIKVVNP
ncbi:hypothetical protein FH581_016005 [Leptospira weilii]|uniref:XAC2610-related protein n=1 Tax=Leptospira weilii TaxID=28184 RepID=UPI001EF2F646|nr:hypothetical protein [Leptospira weilii]ULH28615.1 hypothetical protein FH586_20380 [Leptospira weilii]UPY79708.1 hypothetical protein FH581_016005 [Leptospira weilii]